MSRRLPSLNALRAFEAVARLGSVKGAADELCVTPAAVSRQIKILGDEIGTVLLERDGRGVRPTDAGQRLRLGLGTAFAEIAETVERTRQISSRGRLLVSTTRIFTASWLIPRLENFHGLMPETEIVFRDRVEPAHVTASGIDLLIDWGRHKDGADVIAEKLTDNEFIFPVCGPEVARRIARTGDLSEVTFLHCAGTPRSWNWPDWPAFLAAVGLDGIDAGAGVHFPEGLILDAARADRGLALANAICARDDLAAGRLVRPVAERMAIDCGYWMLTPKVRVDRPAVRAFRAWLKDEIDKRCRSCHLKQCLCTIRGAGRPRPSGVRRHLSAPRWPDGPTGTRPQPRGT